MLSRLAALPLISGATQKANSDYKGRWLGVYSPDVPSNRRYRWYSPVIYRFLSYRLIAAAPIFRDGFYAAEGCCRKSVTSGAWSW